MSRQSNSLIATACTAAWLLLTGCDTGSISAEDPGARPVALHKKRCLGVDPEHSRWDACFEASDQLSKQHPTSSTAVCAHYDQVIVYGAHRLPLATKAIRDNPVGPKASKTLDELERLFDTEAQLCSECRKLRGSTEGPCANKGEQALKALRTMTQGPASSP